MYMILLLNLHFNLFFSLFRWGF